jgi:predicted MPP superfamily phosphohydrolase
VTVRRLAAGIAAAAAAYLLLIEPRRLVVERWRVRVDGLPPAAEGLRLVHLTDLHVGAPFQRTGHLRRAVRVAVAARPDVAFLTGDIMHRGRWDARGAVVAPLAVTCPTFAVLGNHDHARSPVETDAIADGLRALGVRVLRNAHAEVGVPALPWRVVGIDDPATWHADLLAAVAGIAPRTRLLALLTHVPEAAEAAPPGWFPLVFAGHTHGIRLCPGPLRRLPRLGVHLHGLCSRYPRGFHDVGGALLYVNRGVGLSHVPLRLGSLPEVAVFELTSGAGLPPGVRYCRLP